MTTTIIVRTHDWPVTVTPMDEPGKPAHDATIVEPHSERSFNVWQGRDLMIHEEPLPPKDDAKASG